MITTPVIERELRQQSRRSAAAWIRVMAAGLAGLTAVAILGSTPGGRVGGMLPGLAVFNTLSVVAFIFCLLEGVRQTSDCLSSEKREGTLGLLLLTDLRGLDVILGKLAATSVGSFYVVMAIFPMMAMALPYGGVTSGEFWRTQLALLDTLFLGLAVGMWVSSRQQDAGRSLLLGWGGALALVLFPMLFEIFLRRGPLPSFSPGVALQLAADRAYAAAPLRYWMTLLTVHGIAWGLLAAAGRRLARSWQDEERPATVQALHDAAQPPPSDARWAPEGEPVWTEDFSTYWEARPPVDRPDRALIDLNPARWLAAWVPRHGFLAGLSVCLLTLGIFADGFLGIVVGRVMASTAALAAMWITALVPWLLLAYVASCPLADARRSGALELLLPTPLSASEILESHWRALWLQLRGPVKACGLVLGVVFVLWLSAVVTAGRPDDTSMLFGGQLMSAAFRVLTGLAICRAGLYFSLRTRTRFAAVGLTLLWCVVVPWFFQTGVTIFSSWMLGSRLGGLSTGYWIVGYSAHFAALAYAVAVCIWTKGRLLAEFRELATRAGA